MKLFFVELIFIICYFSHLPSAEAECSDSSCYAGTKASHADVVFLVPGIPSTISLNSTTLQFVSPQHSFPCGEVSCPEDSTCCDGNCCEQKNGKCCDDPNFCCDAGHICCRNGSWCCQESEKCSSQYGRCVGDAMALSSAHWLAILMIIVAAFLL